MCQCVSGYVDVSRQHGRPNGRVCRQVINECTSNQHDCSRHASCIDTADGFTCRCHDSYRDESPDSSRQPGRVCVRGGLMEAKPRASFSSSTGPPGVRRVGSDELRSEEERGEPVKEVKEGGNSFRSVSL